MLEAHEPGSGQAAFKPRKRSSGVQAGGGGGAGSLCTSHFLKADAASALHAAMLAEGAADKGDLHCPKCACRVGAYAWYGAQCACGAWVAPAIQVTKSRVDEAAGVIVAPPRTDPPRHAPRG